jgi:hypothetical protein
MIKPGRRFYFANNHPGAKEIADYCTNNQTDKKTDLYHIDNPPYIENRKVGLSCAIILITHPPALVKDDRLKLKLGWSSRMAM